MKGFTAFVWFSAVKDLKFSVTVKKDFLHDQIALKEAKGLNCIVLVVLHRALNLILVLTRHFVVSMT